MALFVGAVAVAAACSIGDTPEGVAEELIEGELAEQFSLGTVTATCEAPPNRDAGTTFTCTSSTDIGDIDWEATMVDSDTVNVASTNLVVPEEVAIVEDVGSQLVQVDYGITLEPGGFDCGDGAAVIGPDNTVACAVTDPGNGDIYDATVEISADGDIVGVTVADTPRG